MTRIKGARDFLGYLLMECRKRAALNTSLSTVYLEVVDLIDGFTVEYDRQRSLTDRAKKDWFESIENMRRRKFANPDDLIRHVHEIASRPAFFDCEQISLAAINAFCSDYLNGETDKQTDKGENHVDITAN